MGVWAYAILLAAVANHVYAVPDVRPTLTASYGEAGLAIQGFSPMPTKLPNDPLELFKRDVPNAVCGYVSADIYTPFTCYDGEFCGVRTDLGVVGCCTSYSELSNGQYTLTGCIFRTVCYGLAQTSLCTGTCLTDPRVAYCTSTDYPYCMVYSYTDVGLSYYRCNASPGITTLVAETYNSPASTPAVASTTPVSHSSSNIVPSSSAPVTTVITTIINGAGTTIPATISSSANQGQPPQNSGASSASSNIGGDGAAVASASPSTTIVPTTKSSILGPAIGGAVGGLAVLAIAGGIGFCIFYKHKKNKKKAAAAAGPTSAYNANNTGFGPPGSASGLKAPEPVVVGAGSTAPEYWTPEKQAAAGPPSYHSPNLNNAGMPNDPRAQQTGFMSPVSHTSASEVDGRGVQGITPHATGRSELASPNIGYSAGPTSDWNRPYHELE